TWNKIAGAESYLIYRAQDDGRYEFLTATQDINHLDRTVCGGHRYLYQVAADAGAEARPGRRSLAKGVVAELAAPTGLRVREESGILRLSWSAVPGASAYEVLRAGVGETYALMSDTADTVWKDSTAQPGKRYQYKVRARVGSAHVSRESEAGQGLVVDPTKPVLALTFDDGPNPETTGAILTTLEKYGARASFFVKGNNVEKYPDVLRRQHSLGMQTGNHTYDHPKLSWISEEEITAEWEKADVAIAQVTGQRPAAVRPPYGDHDDRVDRIAGRPLMFWTVDTKDWETLSAEKTVETVLKQACDGGILLMHDVYATTAEAVEQLVPALQERGFQLVTVDELLQAKGITPEAGKCYYGA
ncbi:MAG: polysaccharide deacetylase family protein, partial [Eubacteriales bacterium]|nr:polysaccharide deacetylase family protein [Eubacteriales bacterium]